MNNEEQRAYKVAVCLSRFDKAFKNVAYTWAQMADNCKACKKTDETAAEYAAMSKAQRAEAKDVGGFVGGYLDEGARKRGAVRLRSLVTLDADFNGAGDVWADFTKNYACAALAYSTHSNTPAAPRFRLIVPLSRDVTAEEYEAIARRVAEVTGFGYFDPSTFQPERLMYWGSCSRDAEYICKEQTGAPLDADAVLATFTDWRDTTAWPVGERESAIVRKEVKKAGEPTEKPGVIGEFCRTYTIETAIAAFLPDDYAPTTIEGRYTYLKGSTAGGLLTFDNKFAYSFHGTDPTGGRLCNAFDLVRLHRFADLDNGADAATPAALPSFAAMAELANADPRVRSLQEQERNARAAQDFAAHEVESGADDDEEDDWGDDWQDELQRDKKGNILKTIRNIYLILENDKATRGALVTDEFANQLRCVRALPWGGAAPRAWSDADEAQLARWLECKYKLSPSKQMRSDARACVFDCNRAHPVRAYLNGLKWDGVPRIETLFTDYLGAADTPLNRAVTRKTLAAAVARIYEPGTKFDYCLTLCGPEGIGKSRLLKTLGGAWFSDSVSSIEGKEGAEAIQGNWIIELGELAGLKKSEVEGVKAFLSRCEDKLRPAYGRFNVVWKRQCVFFATTNEKNFLRGDTGNRRFWVVDCSGEKRKDVREITEEVRANIWAEAVTYYRRGELLYLNDDQEKEMRERQSAANESAEDPLRGMIEEYLETPVPTDWYDLDNHTRALWYADEETRQSTRLMKRTRVCAAEIMAELLGGYKGVKSRGEVKRINAILASVPGWRYVSTRIKGYGVQSAFQREEDSEDDLL